MQILGGGQVVLQSGHEDGGEVEDVCFFPFTNEAPNGNEADLMVGKQTIAAALRVLCSNLLMELEKGFPPEQVCVWSWIGEERADGMLGDQEAEMSDSYQGVP